MSRRNAMYQSCLRIGDNGQISIPETATMIQSRHRKVRRTKGTVVKCQDGTFTYRDSTTVSESMKPATAMRIAKSLTPRGKKH